MDLGVMEPVKKSSAPSVDLWMSWTSFVDCSFFW